MEEGANLMLYKIVIKEILSSRMKSHFEPLELTIQNNQTIMTGEFIDQSALYGTIATIRDFHLTLVSINPL